MTSRISITEMMASSVIESWMHASSGVSNITGLQFKGLAAVESPFLWLKSAIRCPVLLILKETYIMINSSFKILPHFSPFETRLSFKGNP